MRITEAARRLGMSPRMLRYREELGLLPVLRSRPSGRGPLHRQFTEEDLAAIQAGVEIERRHDITPAALAFGLRVTTEPSVRAAVADLARRTGRFPVPAPVRALDFEKERALRALGRSKEPGRAGKLSTPNVGTRTRRLFKCGFCVWCVTCVPGCAIWRKPGESPPGNGTRCHLDRLPNVVDDSSTAQDGKRCHIQRYPKVAGVTSNPVSKGAGVTSSAVPKGAGVTSNAIRAGHARPVAGRTGPLTAAEEAGMRERVPACL